MLKEKSPTGFTGWAKSLATRYADWTYSNLSEEVVEQFILFKEQDILADKSNGEYLPLVVALRLFSTFNPLARVKSWKLPRGIFPDLESAYYIGRITDDIADGHRDLPQGFDTFIDWVNHLKFHLNNDFKDVPKDFTTEFLFKRAIARLKPLQRPGDDVKSEYNSFFDAMVVENTRRVNGEVKTKQELADLNWASFSHVQNIAFIAVRSSARVTKDSGLSVLPELLARGYSIRDLEEDLVDNICNIPKEVLDKSGLSFQQLSTNPGLVDSSQILQEWISSEIKDCQILIQLLDQQKLDLRGKFLVKVLTKSIIKDLSKLD